MGTSRGKTTTARRKKRRRRMEMSASRPQVTLKGRSLRRSLQMAILTFI